MMTRWQNSLGALLALGISGIVAPAEGNAPAEGGPAAADPFATVVVEFDPAVGQYVNEPAFNDPARALGPPVAGGLAAGGNSSIVSLGAFGGTLTLGFDHTVMDDALNPFGIDAIVFGNAFWPSANPSDHWAECATIEISLDVNENGLADDAWYLIPGSHLPDPNAVLTVAFWDDDLFDDTYPPASASWIPLGKQGLWTSEAFELPVELFGTPVVRNPSADSKVEGIFGYAEYTPTLLLGDTDGDNVVDDFALGAEEFYTTPDDPMAVGISAGSGGGDGFDIAWAIDPESGEPADLPGFDFIRITTAVYVDLTEITPLGETSSEIDAVADAAPDPFGDVDDDGDIDLVDVARFLECFAVADVVDSGCERADRQSDGSVDLVDAAAFVGRITGPIR